MAIRRSNMRCPTCARLLSVYDVKAGVGSRDCAMDPLRDAVTSMQIAKHLIENHSPTAAIDALAGAIRESIAILDDAPSSDSEGTDK